MPGDTWAIGTPFGRKSSRRPRQRPQIWLSRPVVLRSAHCESVPDEHEGHTLHLNGQASLVRGQSAQPLFNDSKAYWFAAQPGAGVKVPNNGVNIKVLDQSGTSMKIRVSAR